jgi:hypothetical protein
MKKWSVWKWKLYLNVGYCPSMCQQILKTARKYQDSRHLDRGSNTVREQGRWANLKYFMSHLLCMDDLKLR